MAWRGGEAGAVNPRAPPIDFGGDNDDPTTSVARESAHDDRACAWVAKIDQHSDRLLLVRAACRGT
jgi:hypothetical protein